MYKTFFRWALVSEVATLSKVAPAPKSILAKVLEAVNLDTRKVRVFRSEFSSMRHSCSCWPS